MLRTVRIGRWKAAVSLKQRKRKKRYCRIMGCAARKAETGVDGAMVLTVVFAMVAMDCGNGGEEAVVVVVGVVAFSMRAQVR